MNGQRAIRRLGALAACAALLVLPLVARAGNPIYNPLEGACEEIGQCVQNVIAYVLGIAGIIALAGIVYGGFLYLTAAGNQDRVEAGKNALTYSIVGLIVIGLGYAIVVFVFAALRGG